MEVKKKLKASGFSATAGLSKGISIIGDFILGILGLIQKVIRPIFSFTLVIALIVLAIVWLTIILVGFYGTTIIPYIGPDSEFLSYGGYISLFLVLIIPIIALILRITRFFRPYRIHSNLKWSMFLTWIASIVILIMSILGMVDSFKTGSDFATTKSYTPTSNMVTLLQSTPNYDHNLINLEFGDITLGEEAIHFDHMHINIFKSDDENIHITKNVTSRGKTETVAVQNAQDIQHYIAYQDDQLIVDSEISLAKGSKWRAQQLNVDIYLPIGMQLQMDRKSKHKLRSIAFDPNVNHPRHSDWHNEIWIMTDKGLIVERMANPNNGGKTDNLSGYHSLQVDGYFDLNIVQGKTWDYKVTGNAIDVSNIEKDQQSGFLFLKSGRQSTNTPLTITLTMPQLNNINIDQCNLVSVSGFEQASMTLTNAGSGDMALDLKVDSLIMNLKNSSATTLSGIGNYLELKLDKYASIDAEKYFSKSTKLDLGNYRNSKIRVSDTLFQNTNTSNPDRLKIYGNPVISNDQYKEE